MNSYRIITDTGCDISPELLKEWGVGCVDLTFRFDGETRDFSNSEISSHDFYQKMRDGGVSKTAAINPQTFIQNFEPVLQGGEDVFYLSFSSGLSTTYNASCMAAEELMEKYPERKVITVDSLCASAGQGLALYFTVEEAKKGLSIEELAAAVQEKLLHICHWFTVDDLVYLKRGGRVSAAAAFVGGVLDIKPVLHVDNEGHLISMSKVRGRKQSLKGLFAQYEELALDRENGVYFISHGDCLDDALALEAMIEKKYGNKATVITDIGAVIGSHSGPGTLALFFLGEHR
ncbi:MAG: DegV family protein [Parasporobacterium sp.]|nr:DegV family protein [Parasporobacterium sp.]